MQKKQKLNLDECTNNFKEDFVKSFIEDFKKEMDNTFTGLAEAYYLNNIENIGIYFTK